MRFSTSSVLLALPVLAVAEGPFEQYKAQFQNFLGSFGAKAPSDGPSNNAAEDATAAAPPSAEPEVAADFEEFNAPEIKVSNLTLNTWKDTFYEPVVEGATTPEEWFVFIYGGNRTCLGHCDRAIAAWDQAVEKFAATPNPPHLATVNCEEEDVLCKGVGANPGCIWILEMLPKPAEIDLYVKRMNLSTIVSDDFLAIQAPERRDSLWKMDGIFHPFNGKVAEYGLTTAVGYVIWGFNIIPSWLLMFAVSIISRMMMTKRMQGAEERMRTTHAPAGGAAPAS